MDLLVDSDASAMDIHDTPLPTTKAVASKGAWGLELLVGSVSMDMDAPATKDTPLHTEGVASKGALLLVGSDTRDMDTPATDTPATDTPATDT